MNKEQTESRWIYCPICNGKPRTKVNSDTVLVRFSLLCPKCKNECLIDVVKLKMVMNKYVQYPNFENGIYHLP